MLLSCLHPETTPRFSPAGSFWTSLDPLFSWALKKDLQCTSLFSPTLLALDSKNLGSEAHTASSKQLLSEGLFPSL